MPWSTHLLRVPRSRHMRSAASPRRDGPPCLPSGVFGCDGRRRDGNGSQCRDPLDPGSGVLVPTRPSGCPSGGVGRGAVTRWVTAAALSVVGGLHLSWATGSHFPARDELALARRVTGADVMPPRAASEDRKRRPVHEVLAHDQPAAPSARPPFLTACRQPPVEVARLLQIPTFTRPTCQGLSAQRTEPSARSLGCRGMGLRHGREPSRDQFGVH